MFTIHQAVLIGASSEKVYDAITTQEGLPAWWTPGSTVSPGVNTVSRFPFGPQYFKEMRVTGLKENEFVTWQCITGAGEWIGTNISFELIPGTKEALLKSYPELQGQLEQQLNDQVTLLIFRHDNWKQESLMFAECSYTWGQFLRSLKLFSETGTGNPWPHQHRNET